MTEVTGSVGVRAEALLLGIERVKHAMAKDETRPILATILIEDAEDGNLRLVAADNYRIGIAKVEVLEGTRSGTVGPFLLPRHSLSPVLAFLKTWRKTTVHFERVSSDDLGERASISGLHGMVGFHGQQGTYPGYRDVIAMTSQEGPSISINPEYLRGLPKGLLIGEVRIKGRLDPVRISNVEGTYEEIIMPVRRP